MQTAEIRNEVKLGLAPLWRGFGMWRTTPRLMMLGALPAVIVGGAFLIAFVALTASLPTLTDLITPFADDWAQSWRTVLRVGVGIAFVLFVGWAMVSLFAATTLLVGDPFYERIADHVEHTLGDPPAERAESWWSGVVRQAGDSIRMGLSGVALAAAMVLIDLIPVVGTVLAFATGLIVGGRLLTVELTGRALEARGLSLSERRALTRDRRTRVGAFGAVAYLLFLVPGVSVVAMPAVVAGATVLARDLLATRSRPVEQPQADLR